MFHDSIKVLNGGGKSDPTSTIQETVFAFAVDAASLAPRAAYVPAPPIKFCCGFWSAVNSISSMMNIPNVTKFISWAMTVDLPVGYE